jgi:hypothetical protein
MEPIIAPAGGKYFSVMVDTDLSNPVNMFQKSSTIVSLQDAQTYQVKKMWQLAYTPLQLSVALDELNQASGYVTIESPGGHCNANYNITTIDGGTFLKFKFEPTDDKSSCLHWYKVNNIEKMTVSNVKSPMNAA